jgi:riboflavin kinase
MDMVFKGEVYSGFGEGLRFMILPWVKSRIKEALGFEPYIGTLNLRVSADYEIDELLSRFKGEIIPPEKGYLQGRLYRALIKREIQGGLVRPEVPDYPKNIVELIAPVCLRQTLGLEDGDEVEFQVWLE